MSDVCTSSYYPSRCSGCGRNGLSKTFNIMLSAWQKKFVKARSKLIGDINSGKMTLQEMAQQDTLYLGYTKEMWHEAGIYSDCCKIEILSHIPYDLHQRDYNDADRALPPDFDTEAIVCSSVQTSRSLETPLVFDTIGTNVQYSN